MLNQQILSFFFYFLMFIWKVFLTIRHIKSNTIKSLCKIKEKFILFSCCFTEVKEERSPPSFSLSLPPAYDETFTCSYAIDMSASYI